jgi:adenylyltransferase/sulfurtransferase
MYLAASGAGELLLIDHDCVELSNLQRQIIHDTTTLGWSKPRSAAAGIGRLNPDVRVTTIETRMDEASLLPLLQGVSVVLDCSDNFRTRHAINRACMASGVALISAAALGWEGQLAVFDPRNGDSPCYRCLYPGEGVVENRSCAVNGIAAPVVGVMGVMQALLALKLIAGAGDARIGELMVFDALRGDWQYLRVPRNAACPDCSQRYSARPQ